MDQFAQPSRRNANAGGQPGESEQQSSSDPIIDTTSLQVNAFHYYSVESVVGRVLGALLRGEVLTGKDAWLRFGTSRLSHHIWQLREDGWPVQTREAEVITSDAGRKAVIAEYSFWASVIELAGERGQQYAAETLRIERERRAA